jgi:hypothetical protein
MILIPLAIRTLMSRPSTSQTDLQRLKQSGHRRYQKLTKIGEEVMGLTRFNVDKVMMTRRSWHD